MKKEEQKEFKEDIIASINKEQKEFKEEIITTVNKEQKEFREEIIEAVSFVIDKRLQVQYVKQEEFEDRIIKTIKDVMNSNSQAASLAERVENTEVVLKSNVLPRLDVLETKVL